MHSDSDDPKGPGFPIQRPADRSLFASSPRLIAGYHVFHRLLTPRHPPRALSSFITPTYDRETKLLSALVEPRCNTLSLVSGGNEHGSPTGPRGPSNRYVIDHGRLTSDRVQHLTYPLVKEPSELKPDRLSPPGPKSLASPPATRGRRVLCRRSRHLKEGEECSQRRRLVKIQSNPRRLRPDQSRSHAPQAR